MSFHSKIKIKKYLKIGALLIAGILAFSLIVFGIYSVAYSKKTFYNQYLAGKSFAGENKQQLEQKISLMTGAISDDNITLILGSSGKQYSLKPAEIGLSFENQKMSDEIWLVGREGKIWDSLFSQLKTVFVQNNHEVKYSLDEATLSAKIKEIADEIDEPEKDFSLIYQNGKFSLTDEQVEGKRLDQTALLKKITDQFSQLKKDNIVFALDSFKPQVTRESAEKTLALANKLIDMGEVQLNDNGQIYKLDLDTIGGLIISKSVGSDLKIIFNGERANKYLQSLATSIDMEPVSSKLTTANGKVTIFQPSRDGRKLDQLGTLTDIENTLFSRIGQAQAPDPSVINLKITVTKPEVSDNDIDKLGIKELIGTAVTDFKGSTSNRVHNITVGASALNGVMLKPGEEFSTLSHLGTIDASGGYLEELVIKDNSTTPEFGGGLCQVSSTLFRAALNSGMKITARQNHKYRVSYYEPPVGMDATIYDPAPDFKFVNNFSTYTLIQSKVVGTKITFELYGTKDNRVVSVSDPILTDITTPDPPIYTETDTLPLGQTKRVEKPHQGGTATFGYKVTAVDGTVLQAKTFKSVYVPWRERWLVGKGTNVPANCSNGAQDGDEIGADCGGSCPKQCS